MPVTQDPAETSKKIEATETPENSPAEAVNKMQSEVEAARAAGAPAPARDSREEVLAGIVPQLELTDSAVNGAVDGQVKLQDAPEQPVDATERPVDAAEQAPASVEQLQAEMEMSLQDALDQVAAQQKIRELSEKYNIKFETPETSDYGDRVRQPTLAELKAIENALERSPTASAEKGWLSNKPLVLTFLKDNQNEPPAQHQAGMPRVVVFGPTDGSLETHLLHEFGHNEDRTLKGVGYENFGWRQAIDPETGKANGKGWLFEANDGKLYRAQEGADENGNGRVLWIRTDGAGTDLAPNDPDGTLTNQEMYDRAKVKPPSGYFYLPEECAAEALAMYRGSEASNAELYKTNPEIYKIVRDYDQKRLNGKYGVDGWLESSPRVYRDIDGQIKAYPKDGQPRRIEDAQPVAGISSALEGAAAAY